MIVNWPTYLVKYIAMSLISSRMTSEISGYIEYNYPTEHILTQYKMNETFFEMYNNRLDVALVDPKLRLYIIYFLL